MPRSKNAMCFILHPPAAPLTWRVPAKTSLGAWAPPPATRSAVHAGSRQGHSPRVPPHTTRPPGVGLERMQSCFSKREPCGIFWLPQAGMSTGVGQLRPQFRGLLAFPATPRMEPDARWTTHSLPCALATRILHGPSAQSTEDAGRALDTGGIATPVHAGRGVDPLAVGDPPRRQGLGGVLERPCLWHCGPMRRRCLRDSPRAFPLESSTWPM